MNTKNIKKVKVNERACIGCTLCTQIAPETFEMNVNGKSIAKNPSKDSNEKIQEAINNCPVSCIHWE